MAAILHESCSAGIRGGPGRVSMNHNLSCNINTVPAKPQNVTAITFTVGKSRYRKIIAGVNGTCTSVLTVYLASARSPTDGQGKVTVSDLRWRLGDTAEDGVNRRFVEPKLGCHLPSTTELDDFAPISALVEGFVSTEARA
jgi:hypothetical protein